MLYVSKGQEKSSYFNRYSALPEEVGQKKQRIDRNKLYKTCQVTGWSAYTILNIIVLSMMDTLNWQKVASIFILCAIGLWFTHLYRNHIKRENWVVLPLKKIIPRIFAASITIGIILFSLIYTSNQVFEIYDPSDFKPSSVLIGTVNLSSVIIFWSVIYFAFHYFENYKKAEIESLIWENAVKEFELRTLRSQLNPHFMFNALNSIRALIKEDPQNAQNAVTRLSNLLRYALKIERAESVPLEEELEAVENYLALEKIRFEERLKYYVKVDSKSGRIEIPPMMIQTLVENGIKHGISKRTEGGKINIETALNDSNLLIKIINTGQINPEALKLSAGFGINNTKHRLSLIYGEKSQFRISNYNEEEVLAELIIPVRN
ncbi:MAG: histidine kinase [Ignavibacteriales bacterium]|nr:MAG: histidine kinase [Ignavibacteriales bacterium]